jgi:hypothetical protein
MDWISDLLTAMAMADLQILQFTVAHTLGFSIFTSRILATNCGEQSGAGAGFLRVLRFPLPIFIPPVSPQSPHLSSGTGTIGQ